MLKELIHPPSHAEISAFRKITKADIRETGMKAYNGNMSAVVAERHQLHVYTVVSLTMSVTRRKAQKTAKSTVSNNVRKRNNFSGGI